MMKRIILILLLLLSNFSIAQTPGVTLLQPQNVAGPYSNYFPAGQTGFVPTGGSTVGNATGVTVSVNGAATAVSNGAKISIPVGISSTVSRAAVGAAAIVAWRVARVAAGPIGVGITAWQIYNAYQGSTGLITCPAPDFFCKDKNAGPPTTYPANFQWWSGTGTKYDSPDAACNALSGVVSWAVGTGPSTANCYWHSPTTNQDQYAGVNIFKTSTCATGFNLVNGLCVSDKPIELRPATDPEIQSAGDTDMGSDSSGSKTKKYWDAANSADDASRASGGGGISPSVMVPSGSSTTVTAPPVTGPQQTIGTQTANDANGVPQTTTTTQTTTVTPQSSGSGSSTTITYNITNVTTTTITNNTSTTINNPPTVVVKQDNTKIDPSTQPTPTEFPKDYNKEVTQQKVLDEMSGTNAPAAPASQEDRTKTAVDKTNLDLDTSFKGIPNAFTTDKANWFSWVWTAPMGTCNAADYSGSVHGYAVSWGGFCEWVPKIRDALGWLFALYGAIVIYGQIFKGNE